MNINQIVTVTIQLLTDFGLKLLGAVALWIIGQRLIDFCMGILKRGFKAQHVDPTLISYLVNIITVTLSIFLAISVLGIFGIQTTSFAALLAAAGFAIGAAWSGLLANFAAGAFLLIFRPFKVGDFICAAGVTGRVKEIGMFTTIINSPDNVMTIVSNNKIFGGNIQNFTANPYRRVDLVAQIDNSVDHNEAIGLLKEKVCELPHVLADPAPDIEILELGAAGPILAVRPYCHHDHYWQVYFATNKAICDIFNAAGYPVPKQHYAIGR